MSIVQLTHLQKVVAGTTAVEVASLVVNEGEITAVTGLTGEPKSTFLALLTGQTRPTAGTVRVAGTDPALERRRLAQALGILPAENGLYGRLSVRQNLAFFAELYGLPAARVDEVLSQVGLADQAGVRAESLPIGLARRLAFGRAILHQPDLLLLVDPFVACDAASVELLGRLLKTLAEAGTAALIIADESSGLSRLCQTICVFDQGRLSHSYRPGQEERTDRPFKIPARLEGKVALVNPADILYATSEDGRTYLCTSNGRVPTHLSLGEVEERLARSGFFRAHRSYLVNLQHIKEVVSYTRDSYTLMLDGGDAEIPLSKSSARELRELLGY
jgi:ABC-2 type transport system ATP-binding protein